MARTIVLIIAAAGAMTAIAADTDVTREIQRLKVPAKLQPKNPRPLFLLRAEGVQKYEAVKKGNKLEWQPQGPDAILLDYDTGKKVGSHSKGPVWEGSTGSKVDGKVIANEPATNPTGVDWLLLEGKGDGGEGRFGKVAYIARVDTWGGKPPATPPAKVGATTEARYQATYIFFGK